MSRRLRAVVVAGLLSASCAAPALAHQGNPNYRSEIDGIQPSIPGLDVQVLNYDDSLELQNDTGETVIVEGYEHEPYVRIDPDGQVSVNTNSPAYYLNDDRYGETDVPASADPNAEPDWEAVDSTGQYVWHDHRSHYMSTETPSQVTDENKRTKIFDYRVPIQVGDRPAEITGTLYWVGEEGGFPIAPFIGLAALVLLAGAAVLIRRRRSRGSDSEPDRAPAKEAW